MGKGDRKTAKGKRSVSSYGNARSHVEKKAAGTATAPVVKKVGTKSVTKAPVKKAVAKKVATKAG
ncbi:MAG: 30S ribosomal protein THX [Lysobacter sp.]|nr:30S ribosomal protein THX [Lysobacter sp.]